MAVCGAAVRLLLACLLAVPAASAASAASTAAAVLLDDVLESLYRVLKFLLEHPPDLIFDTVFGVFLAKGQLKNLEQMIPKHPDRFLFQPSRRMNVLLAANILEKMCEEIAVVAPHEPPPNTVGYDIMMDRLLRFHEWEFYKPMKRKILLNTDVYKNAVVALPNVSRGQFLNLEKIKTLLFRGSPTEHESDTCIVELLNSSTCMPSQECRQIEMGSSSSSGYATTHRLLYLQIARQTGCRNSSYFMDVDDRIMDLCAVILKDAEFIAGLGVSPYMEDLFVEQILLCGIEGFAEFVRPSWIRKVLSMQRPEGCYGDMAQVKLVPKRRAKRNEMVSAYNCMMHVTGLAAGALALSARALVEMYGL